MQKYRIMVLAEFPRDTRHQRKVVREFEELLFAAGFSELQAGVFTRVSDGYRSARRHMIRIRSNAPECGTVRLLAFTEQQFAASELVAGAPSAQETEIGSQLDVFL